MGLPKIKAEGVMDLATLLSIFDSSVRLGTPLLLACLAGLFSERAGVFDIGLEGKMLVAAFLSAAIAYSTGSAWLGLLAGIAASMVFALIHGIAAITFRGNQLISGVAINFLASGLTVLIGQKWFGLGGGTPALSGEARFKDISLPFADAVKDVPVLGPIYDTLISGHSILVYAAFLCVPLTWWVLYRTRFGLRLRAVGENPAAVDTAGVSVVGLRFAAICIAGLLCGVAGSLSLHLARRWLWPRDDGRPGLYRPGRADLRQMAPVVCAWRHNALRFSRGPVEPLPDDLNLGGMVIPESGDGRPALYPDRHHPCRLRRQGHPTPRRRRTLCQGTLRPPPQLIQARAGAEPVRLGLILGSGLGPLADAVDGIAIAYADLPGFPHAVRLGHNPKP